MTMTPIEKLRKTRSRLMKAYIFHVGWFASSCASAATDAVVLPLSTLMLLTLITVPPVLIYTVSVHKACKEVDPKARTAGLWQVIFFSIFLTPLESGLVLPARNLWVSRRILRAWKKPNKVKNYRTLRVLGRAENARPF
jgi:hypothetical protein